MTLAVFRSRARAHPWLRWLAGIVVALVLAACAGDQSSSAAGSEQVATSEQTAGGEQGAAPDANLVDGCVPDAAEGVDYFPDKVEFSQAAGVDVRYADTYKVVEVRVPGSAQARPVRYVLLQCGAPQPPLEGDLADARVIEVPAQQVISLTTTNLPHFDELGAVDQLVGVGTASFVTTPAVRRRVESGGIDDYAGAEGQPQTEKIIGAGPDLLILDAFGETVTETVERFEAADIPTAVNADFDEQTLLGRAEWLKFTALFLNREAEANTSFDRIAARYREVAEAGQAAGERPTVLFNTPFEGTWFTPGGDSFQANAVADAGGSYVFGDDDSSGSLELDIETVLDEAADADVWLQAGSVNGSLDDLLAVDERFDEFAAFRQGQVWAYDRRVTETGGNAVFELAYTRADLFLADLVEILHPDVLSDHELVFFGKVPGGGGGN